MGAGSFTTTVLRATAVAATFAFFVPPCAFAGDAWHVVVATRDWTWGEDYAFAYATYMVACEPGRTCDVGTGMFVNGVHSVRNKRLLASPR